MVAAGEKWIEDELGSTFDLNFPLGAELFSVPSGADFPLVDTPWDGQQGFVIKEWGNSTANATLYCIDCVVQGGVALSGSVEFSLTQGLTKGLSRNRDWQLLLTYL